MLAKPASVTLSTFQLARFWLNAVASRNMLAMLATRAVFHEPMFWLNVCLLLKSEAMLLTAAVFQPAMSP